MEIYCQLCDRPPVHAEIAVESSILLPVLCDRHVAALRALLVPSLADLLKVIAEKADRGEKGPR